MGGKKKTKVDHTSRQKQKQEQRNMRHFHRRQRNRVNYGGAEWHSDFKKLTAQLEPFGLMIKDVAGDGNCLFRAIADQIENAPSHYDKYREAIMKFVEDNREMFEPFVEDDVPFPDYVANMRKNGSWGGNIEIQACSLLYNVNIIIHQLDQPLWEIINFEDPKTKTIHLSYHDGDHYASVRALNGDLPMIAPKSKPNHVQVAPTSTPDRPPDAFEISVMEAAGCIDITQVRQALEDNEYDYDATIAFLMMLQQTNDDGATTMYHETPTVIHEHHNPVSEIAHNVHAKMSKISAKLHVHDHHHQQQQRKQKGKKNNSNAPPAQPVGEISRNLGALCI